jgi:hypothetical protein
LKQTALRFAARQLGCTQAREPDTARAPQKNVLSDCPKGRGIEEHGSKKMIRDIKIGSLWVDKWQSGAVCFKGFEDGRFELMVRPPVAEGSAQCGRDFGL